MELLIPVPLLVGHQAAAQPKTLFEVKAGHHGNALSKDNGAYRKKMIAGLDGVMKS